MKNTTNPNKKRKPVSLKLTGRKLLLSLFVGISALTWGSPSAPAPIPTHVMETPENPPSPIPFPDNLESK